MKYMKLKRMFIIAEVLIIMLSSLFALYIPLMMGNFYLFIFMVDEGINVLAGLGLLMIIALGLMFVCLFVVSKIMWFFVDLYGWQKKFQELKKDEDDFGDVIE